MIILKILSRTVATVLEVNILYGVSTSGRNLLVVMQSILKGITLFHNKILKLYIVNCTCILFKKNSKLKSFVFRHLSETIKEEDDEARLDVDSKPVLKLYKCSDSDGVYKITEIKSGPPIHHSDLDSNVRILFIHIHVSIIS